MAHLPNPATHIWSGEVVGGASGDPAILKLIEQNLLINGDFEDEDITNWTGDGTRYDAGSYAMKGNYVLAIANNKQAITQIVYGSATKILLTGFMKILTKASGKTAYVKFYDSTPTTPKSIQVTINTNDAAININNWVPFYVMADLSTWTGNVYIKISVGGGAGGNGIQVDDLRVYAVNEVITMNEPNVLKLTWQRYTDANYELLDGTNKDYLRGWRSTYSLGYEYCSKDQLINDIGISENMFNFFIPHSDNLNGDYVRMLNDFDSSYFHDRYIGHTQELQLTGIFLRKFKNKEYGSTYFTVTTVS